MNDEQCTLIVESIRELTNSIHIVGEKIDNIGYYSDYQLRKEVNFIAQILEDIKDYKL